jgi:hypothetical protein
MGKMWALRRLPPICPRQGGRSVPPLGTTHPLAGVLRKIRGRVTGNLRKSLTATVALPRRPRPHPHGVLGGWAAIGGAKNDTAATGGRFPFAALASIASKGEASDQEPLKSHGKGARWRPGCRRQGQMTPKSQDGPGAGPEDVFRNPVTSAPLSR